MQSPEKAQILTCQLFISRK